MTYIQTMRNVAHLGAAIITMATAVSFADQPPAGAGAAPQAQSETPAKASADLWFTGTVDKAFEAAKGRKFPLLLFYTAVWCPYCNEIKHSVFSRPEFQQLMQQVIPVMVDGDGPEATAVSDRFALTGFPTVVFFNSEGKELTRFSENLTMDEFQTAFANVVAANASIAELLARAEKGRASKAEWRTLARFPWDNFEPDASIAKGKSRLEIVSSLEQKCPRRVIAECPLFSADLLAASAEAASRLESASPAGKPAGPVAEDAPTPAERTIIRKTAKSWRSHLRQLRQNTKTSFATRSFFLNSSADLVRWLVPSLTPAQESRLRNELQATVAGLRAHAELPPYHRLETWSMQLELARGGFRKGEEKGALPPDLTREIVAAVEETTRLATSPLVRQPTIGIAAGLLWEINEKSKAEALLEQEIPKSETPYYYQSTLARMAQESGNFEGALRWSSDAAASAQGRMTKPRWMIKDLLLRLKFKEKVAAETFETDFSKRLNDYFAFIMADELAFVGGNMRRTQSLLGKLADWSKSETHQQQIRSWQRQCSAQPQPSQAPCINAFAKLLSEPKPEQKQESKP
jgi:hypothetical protein